VAHLICESLGYFTPLSAANALLHYHKDQPFWCEWYMHVAGLRIANRGRRLTHADLDAVVVEVGRDVVRSAVRQRRHHRGFMAEYAQARVIVERARRGQHPIFMSW